MVYTRINERSTNPNPYINFITALPYRRSRESVEDPEATELLRALAAQLKPVMKARGFTVNSFEEYESNKVFLGRNWNNGETVELVLRDGSGQFYPISMLLSVFCHELAHVKHMNHSKAFHTLRRELSADVAALQRKGYYGDGYWSAGTRIADSRCVSGDSQNIQELPEYTCGGAHTQSRSSVLPSRRRHRRVRARGPLLSTGAQTVKQRKAGSRVSSKTAFDAAGEGNVLDECVMKGSKGSGFGKQAGSQRAREERAWAAERRLLQMQGKLPPEPKREQASHDVGSAESEDEESFDARCAPETDEERLKMMRDLMGEEDLRALRDECEDDDVLVSGVSGTFTDSSGVRGTESGKERNGERHVAGPSQASASPPLAAIGAAYPSSSHGPSHTRRGLAQAYSSYDYRSHADVNERRHPPRGEKRKLGSESGPIGRGGEVEASSGKKRRLENDAIIAKKEFGSAIQSSASGPGLGGMVDAEMRQRKTEALGMDRGRRLGGEMCGVWKGASRQTPSGTRSTSGDASQAVSGDVTQRTSVDVSQSASEVTHEWTCPRCTFANPGDRTTCAMCDGTRVWACLMCTFEGKRCKVCENPRARSVRM